MKRILNTHALPLICIVMLVLGLSSCKKDDLDGSDKTELLSFGPAGVKHGEPISFIGKNLDKVTAIEFAGASVPKSDFTTHTAELIVLVVPIESERGLVKLKTTDGDVMSKAFIDFDAPYVVSSVTSPVKPGENVTITGDMVNWVAAVTFGGEVVVKSDAFVSRSLTQIVVTVPMTAKTGNLIFSGAGTEPITFETATPLVVILPQITGLSPNPVKHADNLTITGTNLDLTTQVIFEGVSTPVTTFVSKTLTQLVVKVPGGTKKGKVTLVAASAEKTTSSTDLDVILPAISSITPSPVSPGANVTITGTNLNLVSSITFENAAAVAATAFISQSATQIVVKVPAGVTRGKVTFGVINSSLTVLSPDVLEITGAVPPPTISFPIYNDGVTSNWNGWIGGGWGGTKNYDNTTPVREGTKSIKIDYVGGWGSPMQLGGATVNISGKTSFKVSIYGAAGSAGKKVNIGINGADKYLITIEEGKWTDYTIPLADLTTTNIQEIIIKEFNGTGGFTIYVDALGLN
ncbi:MAG: IPT/TIG domain-containing protein [Sphingobacteriaceae bacterium]|nr:IPT/TIG domain-containing protein [Sphingobacteriaceae bacterium]